MKAPLLALLMLPTLARGGDTNDPARIKSGEIWYSSSRLERIAKDYVRQTKVEFSFDKTVKDVSVEKRGTNYVAKIGFGSGVGTRGLVVEIVPSGKVVTNYFIFSICGTGGKH